jgi:hypothetical protein
MPQLYRLARNLVPLRREQQLRTILARFVRVRHRSCAENVYHCCVWKTASQWLRNVFSATDVYRYSGLLPYAYEAHEGLDNRALQEREFDRPFPRGRIVTPMYLNYQSFASMPKPENHRAIFVVRDPRDVVVSHYFSSRYSHVENPGVLAERAKVAHLSEQEGMIVHMKYMADRGIFAALRSWVENSSSDPRIRLFRFEDLVGADQFQSVRQLMDHCDIRVPDENLQAILARLSFERLSGGRKPGQEDNRHKYRSGVHGDWQKYFDENVAKTFNDTAGDLPKLMGYE